MLGESWVALACRLALRNGTAQTIRSSSSEASVASTTKSSSVAKRFTSQCSSYSLVPSSAEAL